MKAKFSQMSKMKKALLLLLAAGLIYGVVLTVRSVLYYQFNSSPTYTNLAENKAQKLDMYPYDLGLCLEKCSKIKQSYLHLDENNVYQVNFSKVKNMRGDNGIRYYPITNGLMANLHHLRFQRYKEQADHDLFISNVNWFVDNISEDGCWEVKFDFAGSTAPWCSGMSQGLGISALVRAYRMSGEQKYLDVAHQALGPFHLANPQSVVAKLDDGSMFYEETSAKDHPIHILNGFMFAVIGLWDLSQVSHSADVANLYHAGLHTLRTNSEAFETGNWSLYSLDPVSNLANHYRLASPSYQRLHTQMYHALYDMTGEEVFKEAYERHKNYLESSWVNFIIIPTYLFYQDLSAVVRAIRG